MKKICKTHKELSKSGKTQRKSKATATFMRRDDYRTLLAV